MSSIKQSIIDTMKQAMKSGEKERLGAIRLIQAAIKQKEIDERLELTDEHVLAILDKMQKQRKDSLKQYLEAKREDLAAKERFEITIIQEFLPSQLDINALRDCVAAAIDEVQAETVKDMGKVMGVLKPKLQGRADMGEVSNLVKERLT